GAVSPSSSEEGFGVVATVRNTTPLRLAGKPASLAAPPLKRRGETANLQLLEHMVGARYLEFAGGLDVELLDDAVVDDHRETLAALAHAEGGAVHRQAHRFGEGAIAVGEHGDAVARVRILAPRAHHEGIVDRGAGDLIDALRLELVGLVDETR